MSKAKRTDANKTWVELLELAGDIFYKKGTRQRWVVHDVTYGASLILTPYALNCSNRRFNPCFQKKVTQEEFYSEYYSAMDSKEKL